MRRRFVMEEGVAHASHDGPLLIREGAHRAALRTRLLATEVFRRLTLGGDFECAGEQRLHGGHGDFFHLCESDIGPGPLLAPVLTDDVFSPAVSEFLNAAKILGCEFACGHVASVPEVGEIRADEIVCGIVRPKRASCKLGPAPAIPCNECDRWTECRDWCNLCEL